MSASRVQKYAYCYARPHISASDLNMLNSELNLLNFNNICFEV